MSAVPTLQVRTGALPVHGDRLPRGPDSLRYIAWSAALVGGYLALELGARLALAAPPLWQPQVGLAVAFFYAGGLRYVWPALLAATAVGVFAQGAAVPAHAPLIAAAAIVLPWAAAGLVLRRRLAIANLASVAAVRDFLLVAGGGAATSAASHALVLWGLHGEAASFATLLQQWLGELTGAIVIAPLTMLVIAPLTVPLISPPAPSRPRQSLWIDAGAFVISLAAVVYLVFSGRPDAGERPLYLLFVPLIVLAMRRGLPGAVLGTLAVQLAILFAFWLAGSSIADAIAYQTLALVLGVTTLVLGAVSGERRRALSELSRRSAELRAQQQALSDAMRFSAASETAATMIHELSQPLSAIGTYARAGVEMIQRNRSQELLNVMERIVAETARTREVTQRVRDFFRTGLVRREPIDLAVIVADAAEAIGDRLRAHSISLSLEVPHSLPPLSGDPLQLATVLHNLFGNAADAALQSAPPRWIHLRARAHADSVEVEVVDSGPGIDPGLRESLFEPLSTTKPSGMGLGLAISRTLIQAHGGRLDLSSMHPTTFRFTLPTHGNATQ